MSANNQLVIIGRAGNNVAEDTRTTRTGSVVAEVRLAVPGKDDMGNSITDWLTCQFWNKNAERLADFVKKGDLISVSGSVRVDQWEKDGQKRQKYFIHGENFQMLESRSSRAERNEQSGGKYSGQRPAMGRDSQSSPQAVKAAQQAADMIDEFALDDDELPPF